MSSILITLTTILIFFNSLTTKNIHLIFSYKYDLWWYSTCISISVSVLHYVTFSIDDILHTFCTFTYRIYVTYHEYHSVYNGKNTDTIWYLHNMICTIHSISNNTHLKQAIRQGKVNIDSISEWVSRSVRCKMVYTTVG